MKVKLFVVFVLSSFVCCSSNDGGTLSIQTPNFRAETIKVNNAVIERRGTEYTAALKPGMITIEISESGSTSPAVIQVSRDKSNFRSRMIIMKMENSYRVEYYEDESNLVEFHVIRAGEKIRLS
ncbi:MAG TPA: hypothetical protein PKK43_00660 [Spirochaetota bacterium]|nr:hypothetical protein [Spirochaetota bacterium]